MTTKLDNLFRSAFHEAGHAVTALHLNLPLRDVCIRNDGSGLTTYCRQFGRAEARCWTISAYAGPAAEDDAFLYSRTVDAADLEQSTEYCSDLVWIGTSADWVC
jgi:hypothetical protein